jgi:hypothetical protein
MPFNDVGEGFIPSRRIASIAQKWLTGSSRRLPEGINPSPTIAGNILLFYHVSSWIKLDAPAAIGGAEP